MQLKYFTSNLIIQIMKKSITTSLFLCLISLFSSCSSDENTTSTPVTETGKILFEAQIGINSHIYTMNVDGSNETQITNYTSAGGVYTGNASWFPNASKIVFITGKDTDGGSGIYTMNSDGTNITRVIHTFIGEGEQNPKISPNGNKILFEAKIGVNSNIYVMNIDGSNETQLTNYTSVTGTYTGDASWSPDGSKIVFITGKDTDGGSGIYTMNSDGTNVTRVIHNFIGNGEQSPKFSPNGNKILFESLIGINSHIYTMNTDGSNEIQLTNFTSGTGVYTGDASWSPDGSKIVFITGKDTDGGSGVYTMNSDGTNVTRINHNARDEENPTWK